MSGNGFSVTVQVVGLPEEVAKLQKLGTALTDFTGAMKTIGDQVVKYFAGVGYASQGGAYGDPWPALNPVYAMRKAVGNTRRQPLGKGAYPGRGILVATGTMQRSFEATSGSDMVSITNTAPYAQYHQSSEPRTIMPYRPIMKINNDVKDIVRAVLEQDVKDKIGSL